MSRDTVVFICTVLGLALASFVVFTWPRRHFEKPLRQEMRNRQPVTFRAADTTIEVVPGLLHYWIEIGARQQAGRQPPAKIARISIGRKGQLRQIWYALIRAGATPVGAPPTMSD
jgi:hypothetical protein